MACLGWDAAREGIVMVWSWHRTCKVEGKGGVQAAEKRREELNVEAEKVWE